MGKSSDGSWQDSDSPQAEVFEEFVAEGSSSWTWLYRQRGRMSNHSVGQHAALLSAERAARALKKPGWDAHIGSSGYGFSTYHEDGAERAVYGRYPDDGVELVVHHIDYHGVRPTEVELVEEFRLVFNLWEDRAARVFYYFDESGNAVKAAVIDSEGVRVMTSLIRRYQAAKQMHLALFIDSVRWSSDLPSEEVRASLSDDETILSYSRGDAGAAADKPLSRLVGKRVLAPPPVEKCGLPPYEKDKEYQDFVIGISDTGEEALFSSDPSNLADYFGKNSGNPHYLTPVYFRRDVLNKYFGDPDRYAVKDGQLCCAGLWSLRLDNDQSGHIMVFLGDLGRDIPEAEALYWRSYNIPPPEEGPSETLVQRAFRAKFTSPKSVDLLFPSVYSATNEAWDAAFGYLLFKALHDDDRHILTKLHVPMGDSAAEFDEQVLYLAKLLVDSLNEESLMEALDERAKGDKGLAKLERFLKESGVSDPRGLLRPLANVQGLRSRGAAHRKGAEFDITQAIGDLSRRQGFERLLTDAMDTLEALRGFAEKAGPS